MRDDVDDASDRKNRENKANKLCVFAYDFLIWALSAIALMSLKPILPDSLLLFIF